MSTFIVHKLMDMKKTNIVISTWRCLVTFLQNFHNSPHISVSTALI